MEKWSPEVNITIDEDNSFYTRCLQYRIVKKVNDLTLIEIKEREFRSSSKPRLYYSRILKYRLLGYLLENNPHAMIDYISCTKCFEKVTNYDTCATCNSDLNYENSFFLNCNYFFAHKYYSYLKKQHNLGIIEDICRDQRHNLCNNNKQDIYAAALHPDKIKRILDLTNDLENLDNYI